MTTATQDASKFYGDLALQFGDAEHITANAAAAGGHSDVSGGAPGALAKAGADEGASLRAQPWAKKLYEAYREPSKRKKIEDSIKTVARQKIGTADIGSLLVTALAERMPWVRNEETPLLNAMDMGSEGQEELVLDDYMYRVTERRQGTVKASRLNPENALPAYVDSVYSEKYNTLAFWGDPVTSTFVGSAQAKKQRGVDTLRKEIDSELLRIKKAKNFDYWNGIEQKVFTGSNVTVVGGLISRIFTNIESAGNADLSDLILNTINNDITAAIGLKGTRILFTNLKNVGVVRKIENDRNGGNSNLNQLVWAEKMAEKFAKFNIAYERVWEPDSGLPVPVVHDFDLPSGPATAVMMVIDADFCPREAHFQLGEESGPWLFVRPVFDLRESVMVLDGGTLDDPAEESRGKFTNVSG